MAKKSIKIGNIVIGEGPPKVCVPIVGCQTDEVLLHVHEILKCSPDLMEFRADYLDTEYNIQYILRTAKKIKAAINKTPLIFTFRTKSQGGMKKISATEYCELLKNIVDNKLADIIDIEHQYFSDIHDFDSIPVIYSCHHMKEFNPEQINLESLKLASQRKNTIIKVASTINSKADLIKFKSFGETLKENLDCPLILIGMGENGVDTRLHPEKYGSAITFMKRGKETGPGQPDICNNIL